MTKIKKGLLVLLAVCLLIAMGGCTRNVEDISVFAPTEPTEESVTEESVTQEQKPSPADFVTFFSQYRTQRGKSSGFRNFGI